jgi:hypothetical protein
MRIRLKVIAPGGSSRVVEHQGESLRIGRDPSCELLLEGDEGTAASRQHARIDLAADGATVVDLGSANKTQLNEQVIERPTPLRLGDRVQIGFTGAQLVVLDLDLTRPAPRPAVGGRVLLVAGAGVAAFVIVAAALLLWPKDSTKGGGTAVASGDEEKQKGQKQNGGEEKIAKQEKVAEKKEEKHQGEKIEEPKKRNDDLPPRPPDVAKIGNYVQPKGTRPSVLLQRYSDDQAWTALRSGQNISTGHTLVSLPGYESVLSLDAGVRLNLWGGLPEFKSPVGESVVLLRIPEAGIDADVVLDRGRVEIGNQKEKGPCVVRLSFLREQWDVTLKDAKSRVVVELISRLTGAPEDARVVGLFSQGDVVVKTPKKEYLFALPGRLAWLSSRPEEVFEQRLKEAPAWWAKPPELTKEVREALLFLNDWAERFHAEKADPDVIYTIVAGVRDATKDPKERELGLWFLAALDVPGSLVEFLRDPDGVLANIRTAAMLGLQDWLRRNGHLRGALVRQLHQRFGYPMTVATQMVRLLTPLTEADREKPATYQELIDLLDHDDVGLRHLAFWHLYVGLRDRVPDEALKIGYDPLEGKKERQAAMARWRKLVPADRAPPRRAQKG